MRAVVYARVSTEHEAQINALENQLEWYKIEASRHSDWEIIEVYALWLDDNRTLVGEFSTILKDLVEYDFSIADEHMKERLNIA